jgi:hypothetical protein
MKSTRTTVDQDAITLDTYESDLLKVDTALGKLAAGLEPDTAEEEIELRGQFLTCERSMFASRLEKGRVLEAYKAIYVPLRKWREFLRVIELPRQTAQDLVAMANGTDSVPKAKPRP